MPSVTIQTLVLTGFGKFQNKTITLKPGINLILGNNEAGKSTLQAFITGMFYGFLNPASKRRSYLPQQAKYAPWNGTVYRGSLVCECDGRTYRIERDFCKESETVRILDQTTGEDLTSQFPYHSVTRLHEPGEKLLGVSKTTFNSTANIAQLCASAVSNEPGFSGEVNDKLVAMFKTADGDLSITTALAQLERKVEEIGTPKKAKSPYGQAILQRKKLEEEVENVRLTEDEAFELCFQLNKLQAERMELQKRKSLLEAQVEQSTAKELSRRYLQAQNLKLRIERLEKEEEKVKIYSGISLEEIDRTQKKIGIRSQLLRSLDKYDRSLDELEKRINEMDTLYATLGVSPVEYNLLEQFDQMQERYHNHLGIQEEIKQLELKRDAILKGLTKMAELDSSQLEAELKEYEQLEQEKNAAPKTQASKIIQALLFGGAGIMLLGLMMGVAIGVFGIVVAVFGALLCILGILLRQKATKTPFCSEGRLQIILARQQEILQRYGADQAEEAQEAQDFLKKLLGKVQLNNYKFLELKEQAQNLAEEIQTKTQKITKAQLELEAYLEALTAEEHPKIDQIRMKSLMESVKKAKRIRTEQQNLFAQKEQLFAERESCHVQLLELEQTIQAVVQSCKEADVTVPEDLERCRAGKQKLSEIHLELDMQRQLLAQSLGNYSLEELEALAQNVRSFASLPTDPQEEQKVQSNIKETEEALAKVYQKIATVEGRQQVLEKTQRPLGVVEKELTENRSLCERYDLELKALQLAKEKIEQVSGKLHRDFAPQLNQKVSDAVSFLTEGRYRLAVIDQNMQIRLEEKESGKLVELSYLSSGTVDLIYLIMRIELMSLLKGSNTIPILLDDSFIQLDDTRLRKMLQYLSETQTEQILLFSCHTREKDLLDQLKVNYQSILL